MPFSRAAASADTCVLSDFIRAERFELLWRLYPEGVWIDPGALDELQAKFGSSIAGRMRASGCEPLVEKRFEYRHYLEMAEIKKRRPALRHPDIACIVVAGMHGTCQ